MLSAPGQPVRGRSICQKIYRVPGWDGLPLVTEGLRKPFQTTERKMANRVCYGYDVRPEGDLTVNESEAKAVYTDTVHLQKAMVIYGTQFQNSGELAKVLVKNHHDSIISAAV